MSINGLMKSTLHPMHKVRARINFATTSRTFVCRKCRGESRGLFFRGAPPNTPGEKRDAMFGLPVKAVSGIMIAKTKKGTIIQ